MIRPVYIEIPMEDWEPGDEDFIARRNFSLYGTRDAAQNWPAEYTNSLTSISFVTGAASPCSFWQKDRELYVSVRGGDFTVTGPEEELLWLEGQMKIKCEIKSELFGLSAHQKQEIRVLNRTIRLTARGSNMSTIRRTPRSFARRWEWRQPSPRLARAPRRLQRRQSNWPHLPTSAAATLRHIAAWPLG